MVFGVLADVIVANELAPKGLPFGAAVLLTNIVGGKAIVSPLEDFLVFAAQKNVDNVIDAHAEAAGLAHAKDARHEFLGGKRTVKRFLGVQAVVAIPAVALGPFLRKIAKQNLAAAF